MLSGPEIEAEVDRGNIRISPFDRRWVGPNSVDLHLGDRLCSYARRQGRRKVRGVWAIDSRAPAPPLRDVKPLKDGGWLLLPGVLYLGHTLETTWARGFVPVLDGRSSLGRLGVFCHITAGLGDDEWEGQWTTEHTVVEPVILYPGDRLFQLTFTRVDGAERRPYPGRYQFQAGVTPSRLAMEWTEPGEIPVKS
jgi:dCTP deaminase